MSGELGIEIKGLQDVLSFNNKVRAGLIEAQKRAVLKTALITEREARRRLTAGKSKDRERLHVRSGALRASLNTSKVSLVAGSAEAKVGFRHGTVDNYAPAHEFGAVITPKRGKVLAIPIGNAVTDAGNARQKGPRAYPDGHWYRSKKGNLVFGLPGEAPLFFGARRVVIPKRAPLHKSLDFARPQFPNIMEEEIRAMVKAAQGA